MKLSTRSTYGMRALVELALASGRGPISATRIAKRQDLSVAYLEQLLHRLKKQGLISSIRGPRGGYVLAKGPHHITMAEVVRILDGSNPGWNGKGRDERSRRDTLRVTLPNGRGRRSSAVTSPERLSTEPARAPSLAEESRGRARSAQAMAAEARDAHRHAQWIAQAVWRCVHERLTQSLGAVTLQDLCDEVRTIAGEPLDHRYVFHI